MLWDPCPFSLEFLPCLRFLRGDFYVEELDHFFQFSCQRLWIAYTPINTLEICIVLPISPELVIATRICILSANGALSVALPCIPLLTLEIGCFSAPRCPQKLIFHCCGSSCLSWVSRRQWQNYSRASESSEDSEQSSRCRHGTGTVISVVWLVWCLLDHVTVHTALWASLWFLNNSSCIHSGFFHKIQEDEPKSENYSSTSLAYFIAPGHCLMLNIFRIPPNTYLKPSFSGEQDHWLYSWTHLSYAQILLCPTTLTHPFLMELFSSLFFFFLIS